PEYSPSGEYTLAAIALLGGGPLVAFSRDRPLELIARARQGDGDSGSLGIHPRDVALAADRSSGAVHDRQSQAVPGHLSVRSAAIVRLEGMLGAVIVNSHAVVLNRQLHPRRRAHRLEAQLELSLM